MWGPECVSTPHFLTNDDNAGFEECYSKLQCEKLNLSFSKFVFGVHRKTQNSAVMGE